MPTKEAVDVIRRFGQRYRIAAPVTIELERAVLGSDYGANGYTPLAQAEMLIHVLAMRAGERLLDVGAGCVSMAIETPHWWPREFPTRA